MVWGCVSWVGLGPLICLEANITGAGYAGLIRTHVHPTMEAMFDGVDNALFQDDNAPPHRSRLAQEQFDVCNIERMDWPPYSPDLNPIENLWNLIKKQLKSRENRPRNVADLQAALEQIWSDLYRQHDIWRKFIISMPDRLRKCISARGYAIPY